jgi:hypothetical protein
MDMVVLFQYAWPHRNEEQRQAASIEIEKMLRWCLKDSVLPDGSFRASTGGEDSLEENEYFGVAFLRKLHNLLSRRSNERQRSVLGMRCINYCLQELRQRCPSIGRGLLLVSRQHEAYVKTDCRSGASPALSKLGGT